MLRECVISTEDSPLEVDHVLLVGLNHRTAPLELREKLSFLGDSLHLVLKDLLSNDASEVNQFSPLITESLILATCNRLEIYVTTAGEGISLASNHVEHFLTRHANISLQELRPHLYFYENEEAVMHLMRVSSGLDSMILGEQQILGQIKQACSVAQDIGTAKAVLSHLFSQAIHAGKRARTETGISRYTTSMSHAAVQLARNKVSDFSEAHMLIIGSGEMAVLAAQAFQRYDIAQMTCINRTYARAEALAQKFGCQAMAWENLSEALTQADVVITATGAPHTVIQPHNVEAILQDRDGRPLVFVDIALPRDVDAAVGELPNVHCYDMDTLQSFVDTNVSRREAAAEHVEQIIREETQRFIEWQQGRGVVPIITAMREKAMMLAQDEVEMALRRMGELDPHQQKIVELMAHRIVNKILHDPTIGLKEGANCGNTPCYKNIVCNLFALDN